MNLDAEKLTGLLQKRYNIPLKELNHIYELSGSQTDKGGQAEVRVMLNFADISKLLEDCGHKLNLYRLKVSGEYIGGVEHSELIKRVSKMLELLSKSKISA